MSDSITLLFYQDPILCVVILDLVLGTRMASLTLAFARIYADHNFTSSDYGSKTIYLYHHLLLLPSSSFSAFSSSVSSLLCVRDIQHWTCCTFPHPRFLFPWLIFYLKLPSTEPPKVVAAASPESVLASGLQYTQTCSDPGHRYPKTSSCQNHIFQHLTSDEDAHHLALEHHANSLR